MSGSAAPTQHSSATPARLPAPPDGSDRWLVDVYAHTHWDREWYLPFERYRMRLVGVIDRVLDVLARNDDFTCFVLDGQTIVVDDYLQVRPHRAAELAAHVASGRLEVGPWYVLPDEFLVSGEALVRNLLEGRRGARRFGQAPPAGYLPDPFGHVAQLPQILAGFGIPVVIFSRGMGDEYEQLGSEFVWRGLDGSSSVVAVVQAVREGILDSGYCNASFVSSASDLEDPALLEGAHELVARLARTARTNVLLFAAGEDHATVNAGLPAWLQRFDDELDGCDVRLVGLRQVVDDVLASVERRGADTLAVHRGELRGSRDAPILASIFSARIALKQDNVRLQTMLERYVEPLLALAQLSGCWTADIGALQHAWRLALQNQPHDSIGGCSVDATHDDMPARTRQALQVCQTLLEDLAVALACEDDALAFNPHAEPVSALCERADGSLVAVTGAPPLQLARLDDVPTRTCGRVVDERTIESDLVRVRACDDGRVEVTARRAEGDVLIRDALRFEDTADAGDEYDFGALAGDTPVLSQLVLAAARLDEAGVPTLELEHRLQIPRALSEDRSARQSETVDTIVRTTIQVADGMAWAQCRSRWHNASSDHRLRLRLSLGAWSPASWADGHFALLERGADLAVERPGWRQQPPAVTHCESVVAMVDERRERGVAVLTRGLHEYELASDGGDSSLYLTLLRSVGWLSRSDIHGRPGHAGPALPTPGGQCLGEVDVQYGIAPFAGHPAQAGVTRLGRRFTAPPLLLDSIGRELRRHMAWKARARDVLIARGGSPASVEQFNAHGLSIAGGELSALKPADDGSGDVVVRAYNPQLDPATLQVRCGPEWHLHEVRLDEQPVASAAPAAGELQLHLPGGAIRSLRLCGHPVAAAE